MTTSITLRIIKLLWMEPSGRETNTRGGPVMSCCGARNSRLAVRFAEFRPLPLLIARCICRRQRSQTSPLRYRSVFPVIIARFWDKIKPLRCHMGRRSVCCHCEGLQARGNLRALGICVYFPEIATSTFGLLAMTCGYCVVSTPPERFREPIIRARASPRSRADRSAWVRVLPLTPISTSREPGVMC